MCAPPPEMPSPKSKPEDKKPPFGGGHYTEAAKQYDEERAAFLQAYGLTVIRIPNNAIHNQFRDVCDYIDLQVQQSLSQLR